MSKQRLTDFLLAGAALLSLFAAIAIYRDDLAARGRSEEIVARFQLDLRRPLEVETMRMQPAADLRAVFLADMALRDALGTVRLSGLDAAARQAWFRSLGSLNDELGETSELVLASLRRRPGWAYHWSLLGQLVYVEGRRAQDPALIAEWKRWRDPLLIGARYSPGDPTIPAFLGGAYLEQWDTVTQPDDRMVVLSQAFRYTPFVRRNYLLARQIVGQKAVLDMLPEEIGSLQTAFAIARGRKEVMEAAALHERWRRTEWEERKRDLAAIEERARLGDVFGLRNQTVAWLGRHAIDEFDGPEGRAQVRRVMELWPQDRTGSWLRDPRARLIEHFLSGRQADAPVQPMLRSVELLRDVPDPVRARVELLAGNAYDSHLLFRESDSRGSFEWTPFLAELAAHYAAEGEPEKALEIIGGVADGAQNECNILLARRDGGDEDELLAEKLGLFAPTVFPPEAWTRAGLLSICIDPQRKNTTLRVRVRSESPAFLSTGWDGGRMQWRVLDGVDVISAPLGRLQGRHTFAINREIGGPVEIMSGWLE